MPPIPRIVVVDSAHKIASIVRSALALLSRQYIMVEVPSAEDALQEVGGSQINLVVTAYKIAGQLHGVELATRICHESLGTPVIVLAEEDDPQLDDQVLRDAPFQYFMRPVAEPFLRGLRVALDGEAAVVEEKQSAGPQLDLGPVPTINVRALNNIVVDLMRDAGAMGIILADRTGRVLIDEGATGYIDRETLAVILGPLFARSTEISPLIGGDAWTLHYYNGERLDVYGLSLGIHHVMCLVFEGSNRRALASVMMYGRRAADQIIDMIGEVAYATKKAESLPPPKTKPVTEELKPPPAAASAAPAAPAKQAESRPVSEIEALFDAPPPAQGLDPISDFDPDRLFGQAIDERLAESMFDPDALSDLAATIARDEEERVGYDEAIDMGILDE